MIGEIIILLGAVLLGQVVISQGWGAASPSHSGLDYYALDYIRVQDGLSYIAQGKTNPDYLIWGSLVLAAANGIVIEAVDVIEDNEPYARLEPPALVAGNHVIIQHEARVYTEYSHLQQGSLLVQPGQYVHAGQPIARVGSSGWSWEPHLHFQAQEGPQLGAQSIPWTFKR